MLANYVEVYPMNYTGETTGREITSLKKTVSALQHQVTELERLVHGLESEQRASDVQISRISEILVGKDGDDGMRDNVERLVMIMNGDNAYRITGVREDIESIKKRIGILEDQRNMIKWGMLGVGVAGVTNVGAIVTVLIKALGG